MFGLG